MRLSTQDFRMMYLVNNSQNDDLRELIYLIDHKMQSGQ